MFAPWIFDVMNQSLLAANPDFQLPDYLKNLSLKDNQIVSLNSLAEKFGISRLPATVGSVQLADNMASAE